MEGLICQSVQSRACLSVFLVNKMLILTCYLKDQTKNSKTCCAMFFPKNIWMFIMYFNIKR